MKFLKILGLAAITEAALTAFLGAGSASATALCTEKITPCPAGKTITTITASQVSSGTLETTGGTVLDTCSEAHLHSQIVSYGTGKQAKGPIQELTWGGCTRTTDTTALGELEAIQIGTENKATVIGVGSSVTVNGIFGTSSVYGTGTSTTLGTLTGGTNPHNQSTHSLGASSPTLSVPRKPAGQIHTRLQTRRWYTLPVANPRSCRGLQIGGRGYSPSADRATRVPRPF